MTFLTHIFLPKKKPLFRFYLWVTVSGKEMESLRAGKIGEKSSIFYKKRKQVKRPLLKNVLNKRCFHVDSLA